MIIIIAVTIVLPYFYGESLIRGPKEKGETFRRTNTITINIILRTSQ